MPRAAGPLRTVQAGERPREWTEGPAKVVAALVLGAASVAGLSWAILGDRVAPVLVRSEASPRGSAGAAAEGGSERPAPAVARVNLNAAGAAELQLLPGIGPALAARIIEDRRVNGPYESVEDLDRVRGIGPLTIERLRDLASVE